MCSWKWEAKGSGQCVIRLALVEAGGQDRDRKITGRGRRASCGHTLFACACGWAIVGSCAFVVIVIERTVLEIVAQVDHVGRSLAPPSLALQKMSGLFQRDPRAGAFLGGDRVSGQDIRDQNGLFFYFVFLFDYPRPS